MPSKLTKEQSDYLVSKIQRFFAEQRSENLGNLETEEMIEFFSKELGPFFYNQGVQDSRKLLLERMSALEDELYVLEQPVMKKR
ncbi:MULTISPECIES: DUF2164 domain-containing protein [Brevibacillus]|jgi:uncharacterized protein (DUF2164 family)|uniref:DUF2164 domain-containing protein n=1 Tax=Brevibacillus parabrevis TaxID=54914 RepID=A0A4Y3PJF5_BREPA|nr:MULTISPECIES: DUF2164 domain-containing protein [Brevibacillus]MBU8713086.1 DUF2164 domain-containing protein [Brevibacillus parabrevis]MDH6348609.1 uncharacterized protein (DUF2164 family) [Brevibacillus sp. 1238]MDR5002245.1 DUF2164 domain-containing protein [Brevibacillus parabrevis]MED2256302.1 DUF2164 domain-containing protein [Brevibacillus parabrevis]NRQ53114.1 DUF2164 domain-containing protein [Brevibacillus sp. HD1.4A]